ncbi:MAG: Gfo/Idh/MocA family oxidoreductase, partial [Cyclobacteriaceae bacterium]|nr:Gfo/Idh/MocA family oxidoreductase [Cyclobacteriaceae bacterium]
MSNKKQLRIGMIGTGFMGRTHSNGYNRLGNFFPDLVYQPVLQAICARSADKVEAFARQWGYASFETDWKKLIARNDIDAV